MAIADTIQSMYTNVGEVYDTITNVSLPEHKNIENIPSTIRDSYLEIMNNGIDVVWDNWEKVVGEGISLTLSNTEHAPMKVLLKGNTYQDSTSGKNLFSTNYSDYNTTSDTYGFRKVIDEIPSGKYLVLSLIDNDTSVTLSSSFYLMLTSAGTISSSSRKTPISSGSKSTYPTNFYTNELKYISFYPKDEETFNKLLQRYKIQYELVDNTTPTSYEPYTGGNPAPNPDFPMPVHVVSGDNTVEVVGKNLLDINNALIGKAWNNASNSARAVAYAKVKPNTTYTISFQNISGVEGIYNFEKVNIEDTSATVGVSQITQTKTITTTSTTQYLGIQFNKTSITQADINNVKIQVEKGSQATTYEPYQSTTYPINLPEGMFMGWIGDYKDRFFKTIEGDSVYDSLDSATKQTLDSNEWYLEKKIGKAEVNLTGNLGTLGNGNKYIAFVPTNKMQIYGNSCYCNKANYNTSNQQDGQFYQNAVNFVFVGNSTDTKDTMKAKYDGSLLYYLLATPTYTKIEGTLASQLEEVYTAKSEKGQTNISQTNDDLPFVLSVSALSQEV